MSDKLLVITDSHHGLIWPWFFKYPIMGMSPLPEVWSGSNSFWYATANTTVADYDTGGSLSSVVVSGARYILFSIGTVDIIADGITSSSLADVVIKKYTDFIEGILVGTKGYFYNQIIMWMPYPAAVTEPSGLRDALPGGAIRYYGGAIDSSFTSLNSRLKYFHDQMKTYCQTKGMPIADMWEYALSLNADPTVSANTFSSNYLYSPSHTIEIPAYYTMPYSGSDVYPDNYHGDGGHPLLQIDTYWGHNRNLIIDALEKN